MRSGGARLIGLASTLVELWALLGGALLVGIVLMTAASAVGNIAFSQPISGDFEIVEVGVAVAVFAFLPYCQLRGANVTADIFTSRASPRTIAAFRLLASITALVFTVILIWRMGQGMADYREYEELTPITGFPIWMAFVPMLASLALLAVACVITTAEAVAVMRRLPSQDGR
jgi:TRAP-type C4-dicarboxylate transport system permease small subunit